VASRGEDRTFLLEEQYRTADNLRTRIALHERFSTNPQPFPEWVFDRLDLPAEADILEVGCGNGNLWAANQERIAPGWRLTLTDLSEGMVKEARARLGDLAAYRVADVQHLPFADESFDAVIANHMLFHVPDRPRALAEVARVLRREGVLIAATNGRSHLRELNPRDDGWSKRFGLENGAEQLKPFFADVEVEHFHDALEITDVAPLAAYIDSLGTADAAAAEIVVAEAEEAIARSGSFHVTKSVGLFRCRKH
jgi:SAM-dependent methyltransferase